VEGRFVGANRVSRPPKASPVLDRRVWGRFQARVTNVICIPSPVCGGLGENKIAGARTGEREWKPVQWRVLEKGGRKKGA